MQVVDHYIKGEAVNSFSEQSDLFNPSTAEKIGTVLHGGVSEVDEAVAAAKDAFKSWSKTGLAYRSELILDIRAALKQNEATLVDICVTEAGKTRADAAAEVTKAIEFTSFAAGIGSMYSTRFTQNVSGGVDVHDMRYPIGVVCGVSPFNFPVLIPVNQSIMAIVTGNTMVMKPSEKVPTAFRRIADIFTEAGLPAGVLNVVNGGRAVVERMAEHPDVAGLTFVGSTAVAKQLRITGVTHDKRVQAFGSGKNHMIVMPDADLDMAADAAVSAAYGAAGQRCMAVSVLVAVGNIADELVDKIKQRIPAIKMGSAMDADTALGPVISVESQQRINGFVADAESRGATLVVDGTTEASKGWNVGASLVDNVKPGMPIYDNEVFGPVLSVVRADTYEQAVSVADSHPLGNGAAIFTRDGGVARQYVDRVEAGMVGVNVPIPVPSWSHPFGGWKGSSFSETKLTGPDSLAFYTKIKAVTSRWPDPANSKVDLGFLADQ